MKCDKCHQSHPSGQACPLAYFAVEATLAVQDDEQREVTGLAIPYGEELERIDWITGATRWIFESGSVVFTENAKLYFGHDHLNMQLPIGKITAVEQTDAGPRVTAKISRTPKGDEVYELLKDGVLDRFSVGLDRIGAKTRVEDADSDNPLLVFENVPAWETSVVPMPAYDSAKIDAVLHNTTTTTKGSTMKCDKCQKVHAAGVTECAADTLQITPESLAALQATQTEHGSTLATIARQVATLGDAGTGGDSPTFNLEADTYGAWLQGLVAGDQNALDFLAFVGQTTGDLGEWIEDTWVGELTRRLVERRRILNLFKTRPLPATGMNVDYGRVLDDSGVQVAEQLLEGDLLAYGKLAFDAGLSAPVRTFGGWGDMSRQVIERSGVAVVEEFFNALVNRYLQVTEAAARVLAVNPANASPAQITAATDLSDLDGWTDFVLDASFALDDAGLPLDFILASRSEFKALAKMRVGGPDSPYALDRTTGSISITGLTGQLFTVPVVPLNIAGSYVRAGSGEAITVFEAPGAPFRLQDDDITNLTKAFSIYGYAAFASTNAKALIRPTLVGDVG